MRPSSTSARRVASADALGSSCRAARQSRRSSLVTVCCSCAVSRDGSIRKARLLSGHVTDSVRHATGSKNKCCLRIAYHRAEADCPPCCMLIPHAASRSRGGVASSATMACAASQARRRPRPQPLRRNRPQAVSNVAEISRVERAAADPAAVKTTNRPKARLSHALTTSQ